MTPMTPASDVIAKKLFNDIQMGGEEDVLNALALTVASFVVAGMSGKNGLDDLIKSNVALDSFWDAVQDWLFVLSDGLPNPSSGPRVTFAKAPPRAGVTPYPTGDWSKIATEGNEP